MLLPYHKISSCQMLDFSAIRPSRAVERWRGRLSFKWLPAVSPRQNGKRKNKRVVIYPPTQKVMLRVSSPSQKEHRGGGHTPSHFRKATLDRQNERAKWWRPIVSSSSHYKSRRTPKIIWHKGTNMPFKHVRRGLSSFNLPPSLALYTYLCYTVDKFSLKHW